MLPRPSLKVVTVQIGTPTCRQSSEESIIEVLLTDFHLTDLRDSLTVFVSLKHNDQLSRLSEIHQSKIFFLFFFFLNFYIFVFSLVQGCALSESAIQGRAKVDYSCGIGFFIVLFSKRTAVNLLSPSCICRSMYAFCICY